MTTAIFFLGGLLLAWAFGRNNFSNVFGSAVGTGVLSLKLAALLTTFFLLLGGVFNSSGTSGTMAKLASFNHLSEAFWFSVIVALVMLFLTKIGIPASIAQLSIGALVGWNWALDKTIAWNKVTTVAFGWIYSPLIACVISWLIFKCVRVFLKHYPIPILYRDIMVRFLWLGIGSFTAYSLGANNLPVLTVPFVQTLSASYQNILVLLFSWAVGLGCIMASGKVIRMVSSKLFPLSSLESLIVGFSGALTLLLFSFEKGTLPALPISMGAALIGAIVGVSVAKGGYGLKGKALLLIISSWIWAPLFSGLLCFCFASIMHLGRF